MADRLCFAASPAFDRFWKYASLDGMHTAGFWSFAMDRIANPIVVFWGWRRVAIAIGAGALSALAMAPFNLFPLL